MWGAGSCCAAGRGGKLRGVCKGCARGTELWGFCGGELCVFGAGFRRRPTLGLGAACLAAVRSVFVLLVALGMGVEGAGSHPPGPQGGALAGSMSLVWVACGGAAAAVFEAVAWRASQRYGRSEGRVRLMSTVCHCLGVGRAFLHFLRGHGGSLSGGGCVEQQGDDVQHALLMRTGWLKAVHAGHVLMLEASHVCQRVRVHQRV
jgi:hypothetical protein